ncbi:uncharacterized protein LOC120909579 [Rana temporaria]|uniref:uncharacterized protein LOC120909579 n=1 Tax=Rana temporaria TaxID=8407 RepID=UPI001AACDEA6|nr:uncharacterized protein LOC120909579 [Rana temporaria]
MEEFLEGHKDMMEPPNTRNPPERCPRPLYSRDSTQGGHTIPHHHQSGNPRDPKVDAQEFKKMDEQYRGAMKEFFEGDVDLYKVFMMWPPNTRNPPERCPRPLYSRDSAQEGHTIPHHHQSGNLRDPKVDAQEEFKRMDEKYKAMKEFFEGNVDLYKVFMMGPRNTRNPPESCSRDSTQEGHTIPHHHQSGNLSVPTFEFNKEIKEEGDEDGVMEESEFPIGHKDLHQDTMVESSNYRDPTERPRHSTQEDHNYARLYQGEDLMNMKVEGEVEETYVRDDQQYTEEAGMTRTFIEEDTPTDISTGDP